MSRENKFIELMRLFRLWNGLIAMLGLLLGVVVATGLSALDDWIWELFLGAIVVVLFVGAGNSLNDYFDVEIDRISHPKRPLPNASLSRKTALYSSGAMFALCIITSIFINFLSLTIVILAIIAMVAYELKLKSMGFIGNIMIALLVIGLFEFAGSVVESVDKTIILALLAGLATLGREIVKDIEDTEGDLARNTLPKKIGARKAGYVAIVPTLAAVGFSPIPYVQEQLTILYMITVLIADALFIYGAFIQLKSPNRGQKIYKFAMVVALAAFAVGVHT